MGPLGELGALFNPGMRHEIEERRSRTQRREEEGNARDGEFRIDLDSGVAVINAAARSAEGAPEANRAQRPAATAGGPAVSDPIAAEPAAPTATAPRSSSPAARPTTKNRRAGR